MLQHCAYTTEMYWWVVIYTKYNILCLIHITLLNMINGEKMPDDETGLNNAFEIRTGSSLNSHIYP